jgi:hypothetical protein
MALLACRSAAEVEAMVKEEEAKKTKYEKEKRDALREADQLAAVRCCARLCHTLQLHSICGYCAQQITR